MKAWLSKSAGAIPSEPINFRRWRDTVDDFDAQLEAMADQDSAEAVVDLWLEDPRSFMAGLEEAPAAQPSMVRRVKAGGMGLQRARTASASTWDQDLADAKSHAASILGKLGNGRY